jgi:hypothetical protein
MALATPVIVFAVNPNGKIIACHALYNGKYSCLTASFFGPIPYQIPSAQMCFDLLPQVAANQWISL